MAEVTTLFWDNGGVILTNGWDRDSRKKAVEKFQLDWADFEDRHELLLNAFECGKATLDDYVRRTVFYRERPFTQEHFKQFMFEQSQALPESLDFSEETGEDAALHACGAEQRIARDQRVPHTDVSSARLFRGVFQLVLSGSAQAGPRNLQPGAENHAARTRRSAC